MTPGRILVLFTALFTILATTAVLRRDVAQLTPGQLINADIMGLLPKLGNDTAETAARDHIARLYGSRVYLAVHLPDEHQDTARVAIATALDALPGITALRDLQDGAAFQELAGLYYRQPAAFLSDSDRQRLMDNRGSEITRQAWKTLASPGGLVNGDLFRADPAFLIQTRFRSLQAAAGSGQNPVNIGLYVAELDPDLRDIADRIDWVQSFRDLQQQLKRAWPGVDISATGPIFHEAFAAGQARSDVTLLSLLSLAAIGGILLLIFRSFWPLAGAHIVMAVSFLTAILTALALFDRLHVMSLVFATVLFGLSLDYAIHFYVHRQNHVSMTPLRRSMMPAMASSMLGLSSLVFMSADVTRQMAVLTIAGLAGAAAAALYILPVLHKPGQIRVPLSWAAFPARQHLKIQHAKWPLCVILVALALSQWPMVNAAIDDDVKRLGNIDPITQAEEQRLKNDMPVDGGTAMLMIVADNQEQALQRSESLHPQLAAWQDDAVITGWTGLSALLPSATRQLDNIRLVETGLLPALSALQSMLPTNPYDQKADRPLSLADLPGGLFGGLAGDMAFALDDGRAVQLISLQNLHDPAIIRHYTDDADDIAFLNPRDDVSRAFGYMRENLMTAFGLTLILLPLLAMIYWRHWSGVMLVLPAILAATLPLPVAVWAGYPVNFFSMTSLFLVLALGLDYCLFMGNSDDGRQDGVWMAVSLSALSSISAFALLLLSSVPVVQMIGLSVAIGLAAAWALSPIARYARTLKRMDTP